MPEESWNNHTQSQRHGIDQRDNLPWKQDVFLTFSHQQIHEKEGTSTVQQSCFFTFTINLEVYRLLPSTSN
jgi:hypothetical protein